MAAACARPTGLKISAKVAVDVANKPIESLIGWEMRSIVIKLILGVMVEL
jgi:phage gp29-like protein